MSARRSTGVMLIASGSIGIFIGLVISATGFGALCGIPMILICIPMMIWGYLMKAKDQELKDEQFNERMLLTQAAASGVNICPQCRTPNKNTVPICSGCGLNFMPAGNPSSASIIDVVDSTHKSKQIKDLSDIVLESDALDS